MKQHLLIVDDSAVMRSLLTEVLRDDYAVTTAADGVEALERLLKAEPADAIVLDLSMPRMGGVEFLGRLRGMAAFAHLPVVVLSGHYESPERISAIEAGADDFMTKPFNPLELKLRLARLLSRAQPEAQPWARPAPRHTGLAQVVQLARARTAVG